MIIAEIAQAHDGSLGILHSYIDALSGTGVDAVKFQTHIARAESSIHEPFRIPFSYEDATRFDYWKRMEFSGEQWLGIKKHCDEKGLEFISSPFSNAAVDLLEKISTKQYKIGSGEVTNYLMLDKIAATGKPVILSSGLSNWEELDRAVDIFNIANTKLSIMQCTSSYPALPEQWGLNIIKELSNRYHKPVGFSDHSGNIYACLAAAALGAEIFEFHVVFDKAMFGPDAVASITLQEVKKLTQGISEIQKSIQHPIAKSDIAERQEIKKMFEKSLAINRKLNKGEKIRAEDLEAKKPGGYGIAPANYKNIVGKTLTQNKEAWDFLNPGDIE